jgi:hypothetical protein
MKSLANAEHKDPQAAKQVITNNRDKHQTIKFIVAGHEYK